MNTIARIGIRIWRGKYPSYSTLPPEVVVFTDKNMVICWHPDQGFPYEHSKPIVEQVLTSNTILKIGDKDIEDVFKQKNKDDVIEEIAKLTFTTKHKWYPRSRDKRAKKLSPDRPYL